jgi:hypothetical protein
MFGKAAPQITRRTDVVSSRRFTLQNVERGHRINGRPVRTRTADLYRVKGPLLCPSNNLNNVGGCLRTRKYGCAGIVTGEITGEEIPDRAALVCSIVIET